VDVVERSAINKFKVLRQDNDTAEECKRLAILLVRAVTEDEWVERAQVAAKLFDQLDCVTVAAFRAGRRDLAEQLGHRLKEDDEAWQTQNTKLGT